jgi:hypothetical protein
MKKDNIPGLEGYYISRLGILFGVSKVTVRRVLNPNLRSFNRIR